MNGSYVNVFLSFQSRKSISWLLLDSILTIRILWAWGLVMCMKYETCERPELVSINNFSNIKEERINKLSSLWLGLILHFLLKRFPWNKKKWNILFIRTFCFHHTVSEMCTMYTMSVYILYRCSITNNYLHWNSGILNINTSPYIKTITRSLVLELLKHWYKEYHQDL